MKITQLYQRLEIAFWSTIIFWMKESAHLRFVLRESYLLFGKVRYLSALFLFLAWAAVGLVLGFVFGLLAAYLT